MEHNTITFLSFVQLSSFLSISMLSVMFFSGENYIYSSFLDNVLHTINHTDGIKWNIDRYKASLVINH